LITTGSVGSIRPSLTRPSTGRLALRTRARPGRAFRCFVAAPVMRPQSLFRRRRR
jgi:hypothetical protein